MCKKCKVQIKDSSRWVCLRDFLQEHIIGEIRAQPQGPLFGIQADEVRDSSKKEQLCVVLRYLVYDQPVQKLVAFIRCENITGEGSSHEVVRKNKLVWIRRNVPCSHMLKQATWLVQKVDVLPESGKCTQKLTILLHESRFKLGCIKIMQAIPEMQVMLDTVKQGGLFFRYSPKKQHRLEKVVDEVNQKRKTGRCWWWRGTFYKHEERKHCAIQDG